MTIFIGVVFSLLLSACGSGASPAGQEVVASWRRVGSWSGRGNLQTQSFTSETGEFRVQWEATNETPAGSGTLKVMFRSGDSGSVIMEAVDHRGAGRGTALVGDRPRWYYLTIESANIDWSVTVEEPVIGSTPPP